MSEETKDETKVPKNCYICGKPAKIVRDEEGYIIQAGIHRQCWEKSSDKIALERGINTQEN